MKRNFIKHILSQLYYWLGDKLKIEHRIFTERKDWSKDYGKGVEKQ